MAKLPLTALNKYCHIILVNHWDTDAERWNAKTSSFTLSCWWLVHIYRNMCTTGLTHKISANFIKRQRRYCCGIRDLTFWSWVHTFVVSVTFLSSFESLEKKVLTFVRHNTLIPYLDNKKVICPCQKNAYDLSKNKSYEHLLWAATTANFSYWQIIANPQVFS